jgi:RNA polymerase sigma-70 factor (ECF subfamily)
MSKDHKSIEKQIKEACQAADYKTAASVFLQHYRNDIYNFLLGRLYNDTDAADVLSEFQENFLRGLPGFQWRCTLRSWAYRLARNAACRYVNDPHRKPERNLPLSQHIRFAEPIARPRSETEKYRRTEIKNRMRKIIREQLSDDEQMLFTLRVNRKLSWRELAVIMSDEDVTLDKTEIDRWSTLLRQRFTKLKAKLEVKLKELARDDGLLDSP